MVVNKVVWNDAKISLPNEGKPVLCVGVRGGVFIGKMRHYYDDQIEWTNDCGITKKVLYWAVLPLTPMQAELLGDQNG